MKMQGNKLIGFHLKYTSFSQIFLHLEHQQHSTICDDKLSYKAFFDEAQAKKHEK